jgi:hypothetical protein
MGYGACSGVPGTPMTGAPRDVHAPGTPPAAAVADDKPDPIDKSHTGHTGHTLMLHLSRHAQVRAAGKAPTRRSLKVPPMGWPVWTPAEDPQDTGISAGLTL